jgi:hypothetical protein
MRAFPRLHATIGCTCSRWTYTQVKSGQNTNKNSRRDALDLGTKLTVAGGWNTGKKAGRKPQIRVLLI